MSLDGAIRIVPLQNPSRRVYHLELSLGAGILKIFDAEGKLAGEVKQGIEIEIERKEKGRK